MMRTNIVFRFWCSLVLLCSLSFPGFAQTGDTAAIFREIDRQVKVGMREGHIPGLSLVLVSGNHRFIRSYGYADLEARQPVTKTTLFQLASCSKAFTAMLAMQLVKEGALSLDSAVSSFLPWFKMKYKDSTVAITVRQLLHHTSGIHWQSLDVIAESDRKDALEQSVRKLLQLPLHHLPGKKYEYATINYDILALIIEKVTGQPFEDYITGHLLAPMGMANTTIGLPSDSSMMSKGYKIGFFSAKEYRAPVYRGNNAAGYIISNGVDMAQWIAVQAGLTRNRFTDLAMLTHQRDEEVPLHDMSAYAMGWHVLLDGSSNIYHDGLNPNFTSYINVNSSKGFGFAVLANSNSSYTSLIGQNIAKIIAGEYPLKDTSQVDKSDSTFSILVYLIGLYILAVCLWTGRTIYNVIRKKTTFERLSSADVLRFMLSVVYVLPFLAGIYLLPRAMAGLSWDTAIVWMPFSFAVLIKIVLVAIGVTYLSYFIGTIFPDSDQLKKRLPQIILMSIISGFANMLIIVFITSSIGNDSQWGYLLFYYSLTCLLYIFGRRFVQTSLVKITRTVVSTLQTRIIEKLFSSRYQHFEKMDKGKIYTVLNDNVNTVGESTNMLVMLITSTFTAIGAFAYLATIAFWATVLTILLVITVTAIFYVVSKTTNKYYERAWNLRNQFMNHINGLVDGFKEISLHRNKKLEYKADVDDTVMSYKESMITANVRFINASMIGESLLVLLLGTVVFAIPKIFPAVYSSTIMSFVIILLYLMKPINELLSSVPVMMQLKIAWGRIQDFLKDIPATIDLREAVPQLESTVKNIKIRGVRFKHKGKTDRELFEIGPIDLEVKAGEVLFIIGGNGSGKTTFAKLITGLYVPDEGEILINNRLVSGAVLSEYFSAVFSPAYLFQKLYNLDIELKAGDIERYLKILELDSKVEIAENKYSTIALSSGQRKRLALLQCFLEDSPIYLFDEWAADQDPAYRSFFYRVLLPEMQKKGKIIIAITHDDNYFDVATRIFKMKNGRLEEYRNIPGTAGLIGSIA